MSKRQHLTPYSKAALTRVNDSNLPDGIKVMVGERLINREFDLRVVTSESAKISSKVANPSGIPIQRFNWF